ncbi:MAG: hypothetical protein MJZ38_07450 [archaeon]|nr:hypothetical protein [archaeon]
MPNGNGSAAEIEWLIEERKRRTEDIEEQVSGTTDEDLLKGLKGMLAMLRNEVADLERELDDMDIQEDIDGAIDDIDRRIRDIDSQICMESDQIIRSNLEVSKRYLQMERNGLLIKLTQKTRRKDPQEARIEELEKLCESRLRLINDLQKRLEKAEKDLSYYKAVAENPDRRVSCGTTRVSVTADELSRLRNEAKVAGVNNYNLKTENRELKNQIAMLGKNIQELTKHCKDGDSQILILQGRVQELRKELENRN